MMRKLKWLCFLVGSYKIGEFGYHSFQGFQNYYLTASPDLQERYGQNNYALISDSNSQLGVEISRNLALKSQNLILLSQDSQNLLKLQSELQSLNPNIDIKAIEFNPKVEDPQSYNDLFSKLENNDIGIFVNTSEEKSFAGDFETASLENIKDEVLNTLLPSTILINKIIPRLKNRTSQSAIVSFGSAFGELGNPYFSISAGNMAYINYLTRSLSYEVGEKVDVLLVTPGPIKKEGVYGEEENIACDSKVIVENSLKNMVGKKWIIGCPKQGILYYFMVRMPKLTEKILVFRGLMNIRGNK